MIGLEAHLRQRRDAGRKLLVPYVTGGLGDDWGETIEALAHAGADAIEVGVPFSDPVMDGPVIQEASAKALAAGTNPDTVFDRVADLDLDVPLVTMQYYNTVFRAGHERYAARLAGAGISGAIVPDLPFLESGPWRDAAASAGLDAVLFGTPLTHDDELAEIVDAARGFVYGVGLLGVTGERAALSDTATEVAGRLKAVTDRPVLIGIGVSTPEQAAEVAGVADGVIVGTAVVRRMLEGEGPEGVAAFVAELRAAIDEVAPAA
ncbi:MAG: tryptophan synthase subunit alpha [Actinomycetota bacterium]